MFRAALSSLRATKNAAPSAAIWTRSVSSSRPSSSSSLFDRLHETLTPTVASSLVSRGYAVVDDALDASTCAAIRREIDALHDARLLRANATFLVDERRKEDDDDDGEGTLPSPSPLAGATLLEKRGIWETDRWSDPEVRRVAPTLSLAGGGGGGRSGGGGATAVGALLSVLCPGTFSLSGPAIVKCQLNDGLGSRSLSEDGEREEETSSSSSGKEEKGEEETSPPPSFPCFPLHFDSDESVDGRRVTAIFYVGEDPRPGSREAEGAGGELLLWPDVFSPPSSPSSSTAPVALEPKRGRLVLFSACGMPHAVSPSKRKRYCFTVWLSSSRPAPPPGKEKRALSSPAARRALAKVLLSNEWRKSLVAAHPSGKALDAALRKHDEDAEKVAAALERAGLVSRVDDGSGGERYELADGAEIGKTAWF